MNLMLFMNHYIRSRTSGDLEASGLHIIGEVVNLSKQIYM